jgi:hypothetical protein
MSSPPKSKINSSNVLKLETLQDVKEYLQKLKLQIHSGTISPQEIDFIPIFHAIQKIVNKENLRNILKEFQNSSELFSQKIQDIRAYISSLGRREEFEKYVKLNSQESLDTIFQSLYIPPFTLDDINVEGLISDFLRLMNRKNFLKNIEFPDLSDVVKNGSAEDFEELIDDVHFERDLEVFKSKILLNLPISISNLLNSAPNDKDRFTHFVYCLYLIQRKILMFDKSTNSLLKFEEKEDSITP